MEIDSSEAVAQDSPETAATVEGAENQQLSSHIDDAAAWTNAALAFQEPEAQPEPQAEQLGEMPVDEGMGQEEAQQFEAAEETADTEFQQEQQPEEAEESEVHRQRVRTSDPMLAEVLKLQKANPERSFAELQAEAQQNLAISAGIVLPQAEAEEPQQEEDLDPSAPTSLEELEQRLDELVEAKVKAQTEDFDLAEAGRIDKEIYDLQKLEKSLEIKDAQRQEQFAAEMNSAFNDAASKSEQYYPDSAVENSDFHNEMVAIHETLSQTGDDRIHDADYVWQLTKMAAKNKGVAPSDPNAQKPQANTPEATKPRTETPKAPIASGNARSTAAPTQPANPLDGVKNPADYYAAMEALKDGRLTTS